MGAPLECFVVRQQGRQDTQMTFDDLYVRSADGPQQAFQQQRV
jgi:hypothetical protein